MNRAPYFSNSTVREMRFTVLLRLHAALSVDRNSSNAIAQEASARG